MNILQQQIIEEIESLDDITVECDGFTRLAATVLHRNNQDFRAFLGEVKSDAGAAYPVHLWIEWEDRIIDFRARMWLGGEAQHGFIKKTEVEHLYSGTEIEIQPLSPVMEVILKTPFPKEMMDQLEQSNKANTDIVTKKSLKLKLR